MVPPICPSVSGQTPYRKKACLCRKVAAKRLLRSRCLLYGRICRLFTLYRSVSQQIRNDAPSIQEVIKNLPVNIGQVFFYFHQIFSFPNTSRSVDTSMSTIHTGARYLITNVNNPFLLNFPLSSTSSAIALGLIM